jgi:hypothetical protein
MLARPSFFTVSLVVEEEESGGRRGLLLFRCWLLLLCKTRFLEDALLRGVLNRNAMTLFFGCTGVVVVVVVVGGAVAAVVVAVEFV